MEDEPKRAVVDTGLAPLEALLEKVPALRAAGVTHVRLGGLELEIAAEAPAPEPEPAPYVDPQQRAAELEREAAAKQAREDKDLREALFHSVGGAPPLIFEEH